MSNNKNPSLRLAVFDLDTTIWYPEMYQLYHPVQKITCPSTKKPKIMDGAKQEVNIFNGACHALCHIKELNKDYGMDIEVAVASRTDEPEWAHTCMEWLQIKNEMTLKEIIDHVEIEETDKKHHFRNLKKKTNLDYEEMVFFDNEWRNIRSVRELGVKCIYTPDGMEKQHWHEALEFFGLGHFYDNGEERKVD